MSCVCVNYMHDMNAIVTVDHVVCMHNYSDDVNLIADVGVSVSRRVEAFVNGAQDRVCVSVCSHIHDCLVITDVNVSVLCCRVYV